MSLEALKPSIVLFPGIAHLEYAQLSFITQHPLRAHSKIIIDLGDLKEHFAKLNLDLVLAKDRIERKKRQCEACDAPYVLSQYEELLQETKQIPHFIDVLKSDSFEGWDESEKRGYLTALSTIENEIKYGHITKGSKNAH